MDFRVQRAKALIEQNVNNQLRLDEIAKQFNISPSRFRHLFKDEVGVTPSQYLKLVRMEKAKGLLETTFLQVKQIMLQVGISDVSRFVNDFKRIYGLSPTQYRERHLEKNISSR